MDQEGLTAERSRGVLCPESNTTSLLLVIAVLTIHSVVHSPTLGPLHGATHLRARLLHLCSTLHHVLLWT